MSGRLPGGRVGRNHLSENRTRKAWRLDGTWTDQGIGKSRLYC